MATTDFARHAARTALVQNDNLQNIPRPPRKGSPVGTRTHTQQMIYPPARSAPRANELSQSMTMTEQTTNEIDRIVVSVENATKRLSQISTNTNSSKRKNKNHVGPWRLGRTLGRGSTGRVRLAKHSETGRLAAVKIVPKSKFSKDSKDGSSSPYGIEREIIIMKLISHQNIMGLYDVWENKGELYLVLEYVEGGELFDYLIKKGKLPEKDAVNYFRQIINGVSYCHQFNICHRDLKPENLLLDKNNNIKIADFGMAALEISQKLLETSCGSPHYASPEIVTGKTYHGSPSDIWSCGIILFALLTGHLPFDDENIRNLLLKVRKGRFIMPNYLSPEAKDLIWKMLKVNPADRIKVNDIFKHSLLKKYETSALLKSKKHDLDKVDEYNQDVNALQLNRDDIDRDILKSLTILFHGASESTLIPKLLANKTNPERVFYYLLLNYKKQHQTKENTELLNQKNSKKKLGNGDGPLKKSKSLARTLITNDDGTTETTTEEVQLPPIPIANPKKKVVKSPTGRLQISASNSYRRRISFNNKSSTIGLSRSSSKRSISSITAGINANASNSMKKRQSILPTLPDLEIDWLNFGPEGLPKGEFATLYEEIFNYDPKRTPKKLQRSFISSSPMVVKQEQPVVPKIPDEPSQVEHTTEIPIEHEENNLFDDFDKSTDTVIIKKEESSPLSIPPASLPPTHKPPTPSLPSLDVINKRSVTEPVQRSKPMTLDPSYRLRSSSGNTVQVLQRLGVSLKRDQKTHSKTFYSKSSTSINLAAILKSDTVKTLTMSLAPPAATMRTSSSNYGSLRSMSYDEDASSSISGGDVKDMTFDFEMPTQTEIATAVPISNGSNITVRKNLTPREDSIFVDSALGGKTLMMLSSQSKSSIVKNHKRAMDTAYVYSPMVDVRGSLYNNPSDLKDGDETDDQSPVPKITGFERPRFSQVDEFNETKSTIMDNSMFADNTDDEEFVGAKRVTMLFDDVDDSSMTSQVCDTPCSQFAPTSPPGQPIAQSPLKNIQDGHFKTSESGTLLKKDLQPQRKAPEAPLPLQSQTSVPQKNVAKKSNWFTKFFSSLMTSHSGQSAEEKKRKNVRVFHTDLPLVRLRKAVKLVLELKRKEGTLSMMKEAGDCISATIPATFALGKPLRFQIRFHDATSEISLEKLKGSKKVFRNLTRAMEFVVETEEQRYAEDQKTANV